MKILRFERREIWIDVFEDDERVEVLTVHGDEIWRCGCKECPGPSDKNVDPVAEFRRQQASA